MESFHLYRSNLRILESYHSIKELDTFEKECHDFYLLMGIEFLKMDIFDEVIIWRLQPNIKQEDIQFKINGKKFIQKWVDNFNECLNYPSPTISFFRGGFKEYCDLVKLDKNKHLGKTLYLAAGKRTYPQYGGTYDRILVESENDLKYTNIPFYKTSNINIFKKLDLPRIYDICFISNFTQVNMKGQKYIIEQISQSKFLQSLKFVHIGNEPNIGKSLCDKYGVKNIEFKGWLDRHTSNKILNQSKFGLVASTLLDGCPRVSIEILCSGTPLLIRKSTRLLSYYKKYGVIEFDDNEFEEKVKYAIYIYNTLYKELGDNLGNFSYKKICNLNKKFWQ